MKTTTQNCFSLRRLLILGLAGLGLTLNAPAENVFQANLTRPTVGGVNQIGSGRFYFRVAADQVDFVALIFPFGPLPGGFEPMLSVPGNSITFALGTGERNWFHGSHTMADHNPFLPREPWLPTGYDEDGNPFYIDHTGIQVADVYTGHFSLPPGFETDLLAGLGRIEFDALFGGAITVAAVPEPTTLSLALLAGLGWGARSRWRKSKSKGVRVAVLLAVLVGISTARADTIVSSLESFENSSPVTSGVGFPLGGWAASSFTTDNQYWNLSSVTVLLGGLSHNTFDLHLYSDAGGQPGISLAGMGPLTQPAANGISPVTFTLGSGYTLNPSTTYWIAIGNRYPNQGLNVGMLFDDPFTFTGVPGASMSYSVTSSVGNGGNPPTAWLTPGPNVALLFAVDGAVVVPEPTTLSLVLLAGLGWGARFRRQ